jgi:hypothetical protein
MEMPDEQPPDEQPPDEQSPDEQPMVPSLDGTWHFPNFTAMIEGTAVTVTVGDGQTPLGTDPPLSLVTQIVVKATLSMAGTAYKLTLSTEADAITVMPPEHEALAATLLRSVIESAQDEEVTITPVGDNAITVTGSFLDQLAENLEIQLPEGGLMGCRDAPCMAS